jgi:hypothetical protein
MNASFRDEAKLFVEENAIPGNQPCCCATWREWAVKPRRSPPYFSISSPPVGSTP